MEGSALPAVDDRHRRAVHAQQRDRPLDDLDRIVGARTDPDRVPVRGRVDRLLDPLEGRAPIAADIVVVVARVVVARVVVGRVVGGGATGGRRPVGASS